ncbi:MAG: hypothetical protein KKG60_00140, partial [Nanoarchaeota archaeon]|nr:hypothetical protein [Nanoarchaeota archaeon]
HYLPPRYVKKCYITTCEIKTLNTRLKKRKYPNSKIQENLQVEIFQLPLMEAQKKYKNKKHNKIKKKYKNKKNKTTPIKLIDTTKGVKV